VSAIHALSQLSYVPTLRLVDFILFFLAQILAHPTAASQERQRPRIPQTPFSLGMRSTQRSGCSRQIG
jgi:hypothetical protein